MLDVRKKSLSVDHCHYLHVLPSSLFPVCVVIAHCIFRLFHFAAYRPSNSDFGFESEMGSPQQSVHLPRCGVLYLPWHRHPSTSGLCTRLYKVSYILGNRKKVTCPSHRRGRTRPFPLETLFLNALRNSIAFRNWLAVPSSSRTWTLRTYILGISCVFRVTFQGPTMTKTTHGQPKFKNNICFMQN
jgi:hypothetical protein